MHAPAPAIGVLLGHYRIVEQIDKGGMGVVYRAWDERLERHVAIKVLPPGTFPDETAIKRFRREGRVLAKLNHPNILMIFDFGQQDGIDYLVTEYVPGTTLDKKLESGPLPQKTVVELGIQLAKGLGAAHREEIIHRDLKPGNLRLTDEGLLKILDFGLARWREPATSLAATASLQQKDTIAGTLPYMAPEQIRCEDADARTDIWGAGAVLYEMATGRRPFPMESGLKLIEAIKSLDPPQPSGLKRDVTKELDAVIMKALDKDRERRYQSARELAVDLDRLHTSSSASGRLTTGDFAPARKSGYWAKRVIAAVVAIACVLGGYRLYEKWFPPKTNYKLLTVLPFDSTGQDEKSSALISGLTETVTAKLAQSLGQNLQLISAREVRDQGVKTIEQAWKDFGSDLVLEGSAHTVGDKIRITCALVDPKTHRQLTASTITASTQDVFGLEDQVASEITTLLENTGGIKPQGVAANRGESNPAAYASYLRAKGYLLDYQKAENIDLAVAELKSAVATDPAFASAYAALGEAYLLGFEQVNRGNEWVELALQNCQKSLAVRETADGRVCLGDAYNEKGKHDLAVLEFQRATQMDPRNQYSWRGLGDAHAGMGNATEAEAAYKKAIALQPQYWGGYSWLGDFYSHQARYADAIEQFQEVVRLAPGNARGYSNIGAQYVLQGKYNESLGPLNKSIEIRPNLEAFNNLGNAYFGLHRYSDAADAFQQGLNLDDSDWLLWGNLGDSLYWSGGARRLKATTAYENAIARATKRLEVNPKDDFTLAFLADYNAMVGHREKALEQIERALALAPSEGEVRMRAGIVYNKLGDSERCLASLEKAVEVGYSSQVIRDTPDFNHLRSNVRFKKLTESK